MRTDQINAASRNGNRFDMIQVLRGLAAMLVVVDHTIEGIGTHGGVISAYQNVGFQCGRFGVFIFFVISGFIMVKSSYVGRSRKLTPLKFIRNRLRRILPLYWICTIVAALFLYNRIGHLPGLWSTLASLFFLPLSSHYGPTMYPILGQGWTLYYEMYFYAIFSLCLFIPGLLGAVVCAIVMGLIPALQTSSCALASQTFCEFSRFYAHPIILLFSAGIVIGLVENRLLNFRIDFKIASAAIAVLFATAIVHFYVFVNETELPASAQAIYFFLAADIVFIAAFTNGAPAGAFIGMLLTLGDASYSIYLTHNFAVGIVGKLGLERYAIAITLYVISAVAVGIGAGVIVYFFAERPIINLVAARNRTTPQIAPSMRG